MNQWESSIVFNVIVVVIAISVLPAASLLILKFWRWIWECKVEAEGRSTQDPYSNRRILDPHQEGNCCGQESEKKNQEDTARKQSV